MTCIRKHPHTPTLPEKYGGSFLFRARYLESRLVRFIFNSLVLGAALLLLLNTVAGKIDQWQTDYRETILTRIGSELTFCVGRYEAAVIGGDLTGQEAAVGKEAELLSEKLLYLPEDAETERKNAVEQLGAAEKRLIILRQQIDTVYRQAEETCLQGTVNGRLAALQLFRQVQGYGEADGWIRLLTRSLQKDAELAFRQGRLLTGWVIGRRLLTLLHPEKLCHFKADLTPLRGIWACREDQTALMRQSSSEPPNEDAIRYLRFYHDAIYGGKAALYQPEIAESVFRSLLLRGGIDSLLPGGSLSADPAASVLLLRQENESELSQIEILTENIIRIELEGWSGTYYRLLPETIDQEV